MLHTDANFHSEHGNLTKSRNFSNSRWWTDAILKIIFWLYLGAILADLCKFQIGDESHADIGHLTKTAIWYADANFHSEDDYLTKIEIFQV